MARASRGQRQGQSHDKQYACRRAKSQSEHRQNLSLAGGRIHGNSGINQGGRTPCRRLLFRSTAVCLTAPSRWQTWKCLRCGRLDSRRRRRLILVSRVGRDSNNHGLGALVSLRTQVCASSMGARNWPYRSGNVAVHGRAHGHFLVSSVSHRCLKLGILKRLWNPMAGWRL